MLSLNSSEVADAVRDGALEAGLIALPWTTGDST
jgi:hypothetical protein